MVCKTLKINELPAWLEQESLRKTFALLDYNCRIIGGCVRDILLDMQTSDIDLATPLTPDQVKDILDDNNIKYLIIGLKYGTLTILHQDIKLEITTLRCDVKCNGRDAEVSFTQSWEEDAKRRDFTINSMSMDLDGTVYDYCGGLKDIRDIRCSQNIYSQRETQGPLVKFIGDPHKRITEDYLRILRFFRFCARFGYESCDADSLRACVELKEGIFKLSGERIKAEMFRLLNSKYSKDVLCSMYEHDVLSVMMIKNMNLDMFRTYHLSNHHMINLALMLIDNKKDIEILKERWKLSGSEYKFLYSILNNDLPDGINSDINAQKVAIYKFGKDLYDNILLYQDCQGQIHDIKRLRDFAMEYEVPIFPVTSKDVISAGYEKEQIAQKIKEIERIWIKSIFTLSKSELIEYL